MMIYICTKFHENILNGIRVMERTRKVNGRTDRRTDGRTTGGYEIIQPVFDGRIKSIKLHRHDRHGETDVENLVLCL